MLVGLDGSFSVDADSVRTSRWSADIVDQ